MRQTLTFTEVDQVNRMTKAELCHWLRNQGGLIYSHGPLEALDHGDLVSMVCDAMREARTQEAVEHAKQSIREYAAELAADEAFKREIEPELRAAGWITWDELTRDAD